jgi:glutathione S-transferase
MKLYHTATSPFVRKVMIAAHELGLADRIEIVFLRPNALSPDPVLSRMNPLSKIPCLVVDNGLALFDSVVIAEYLDTLGGHRLIPEQGPARWEVLTRQALSDGILDAGIQVFYEKLHRPAELQWEAWMEGQKKKVHQGLDALEQAIRQGGEADPANGIVTQPEVPVDLGWIAAAAAIGWLEFRDVVEVRSGRPALSAWYAAFCERPSMQATWPRA